MCGESHWIWMFPPNWWYHFFTCCTNLNRVLCFCTIKIWGATWHAHFKRAIAPKLDRMYKYQPPAHLVDINVSIFVSKRRTCQFLLVANKPGAEGAKAVCLFPSCCTSRYHSVHRIMSETCAVVLCAVENKLLIANIPADRQHPSWSPTPRWHQAPLAPSPWHILTILTPIYTLTLIPIIINQ